MKESTKQKIREAMLKNGHLPPSQKGKMRSEKYKEKMSRAKMGHTHSEETKEKMSQKRTGKGNHFFGKKHSEETRMKMRESRENLFRSGFITPNKKYFTHEEAKAAKSGAVAKRTLILKELISKGLTHTKQEWEALKEKCNHSCLYCGSTKSLSKDHIIPLSKKGTDEISNIQPLCQSCNSKKHTKVTQ